MKRNKALSTLVGSSREEAGLFVRLLCEVVCFMGSGMLSSMVLFWLKDTRTEKGTRCKYTVE